MPVLRISAVIALCVTMVACAGGGGGSSSDTPSASPAAGINLSPIEQWETNMARFGKQLCNEKSIAQLSTWEGNVWYYDGIRVFYQIAYYTGDRSWEQCARYVWNVYGKYVLDNNGGVPGWRVFPHGFELDFQRTGNPDSRNAALLLASNSAFAKAGGGADPELSRETAYLIHAYIIQNELGGGSNPLLGTSVEYAVGHLHAWTVEKSTGYVKPFMVALTSEALIHYYESVNKDARILPAIRSAADWLWQNAWDDSAQAFQYIKCKPQTFATDTECAGPDAGPAPDLDLLVAPLYAWVYSQTKNGVYKEEAMTIFSGGINHADLSNGKQFNQSYRWSFDLVRWLQE